MINLIKNYECYDKKHKTKLYVPIIVMVKEI